MSLFKKKPKIEILELSDGQKTTLISIKVYHPVLWNATMDFIAKNPAKLTAMRYIPDEGKEIRIRVTPKTPKITVAEFEVEDECKLFYDFLAKVIKQPNLYKMDIKRD